MEKYLDFVGTTVQETPMLADFVYNDRCRACGSDRLDLVGSLGTQYVVDFPTSKPPEYLGLVVPLGVMRCSTCSLVQLAYTVNPDRMFRKMWYRSGINEQMKSALADVVIKATAMVGGLSSEDVVGDIGSNDGTLLGMYRGVKRVGFEPCTDLVQIAEKNKTAEIIFNTYFRNGPKVERLFYAWNQLGFKVLTALAMFYDVENPRKFLADVKELLHPDGVFVLQVNSLKNMLADTVFDNISHEHLCYYSFGVLNNLISDSGLRIQAVEQNDVNGGSLRLYCSHQGTYLAGNRGERFAESMLGIRALADKEQDGAVNKLQSIQMLFDRQKLISKAISNFVRTVYDSGQKIYIYGASTRGTALVQTLDADVQKMFAGAAERDPEKFGRYMVGSWTPIVSEAEARPLADYFLILPWHFTPSILKRERDWMFNGGEFIVPLPVPKVISLKNGERNLL